MAKTLGKLGSISGGIIATGPLLVACGGGISAEEWAATDGAAGRINLDDVQEAFKKSNSATDSSSGSTRSTKATASYTSGHGRMAKP